MTQHKTMKKPAYWSCDPGFNPYHVRKHARSIAYALEKALRAKTYRPRPSVSLDVPRRSGRRRTVSVFQVADSAISRLVYKKLMAKNASRLSSNCFAYRTDVTLHDAILNIASEFRGHHTLFIAEYDFSRFFESLSHEYIDDILNDTRFYLTDHEKALIRLFITSPTFPANGYTSTSQKRALKGIPLGTSISLFVANLVAYPMDRRMEQLGVGFARYADDTLIWSDSYARICKAVDVLHDSAAEMGVSLNTAKSRGISVLAEPSERVASTSQQSVSYLGYDVSKHHISIDNSVLKRVRQHIAYLVYSNLLQEPLRGNIVPARVGSAVDLDYVVMLLQVRRYLYGGLTEQKLRRYLKRDAPRIRYRGLMSFYPIVDDNELLAQLDGWLLHTVFTTLRRRGALLKGSGVHSLPVPHGLDKDRLLGLGTTWMGTRRVDLQLPSFRRISELLRRASRLHGANAIANPKSLQSS